MTLPEIWEHGSTRVFVIAEIGKGFIRSEEERSVEEYLENAKNLVAAAKETGVDAVKFQTHTVEDEQLNIRVISPHFKGADRYSWVARNTYATPLEKFWEPLKSYCDNLGITFFSTPMSKGAARMLEKLEVSLWKVGSGDILDFVMLDFLASTGKPVVLSTGMSTLEEMDASVAFLKKRNVPLAILHCVSKYPCPPEDLNLASIAFLKKRYQIPTGFSDHSIGIESSLAAVALGAQIIEKHFSFDRTLWGSDHKVSLTPSEMKDLVDGIRTLESDTDKKAAYLKEEHVRASIGTAGKVLQGDEMVFRPYFRKSLMAGKNIHAGTTLTKEMIYAMRPQAYAGGLPSEMYESVIGRRTKVFLKKYDPITADVLQ